MNQNFAEGGKTLFGRMRGNREIMVYFSLNMDKPAKNLWGWKWQHPPFGVFHLFCPTVRCQFRSTTTIIVLFCPPSPSTLPQKSTQSIHLVCECSYRGDQERDSVGFCLFYAERVIIPSFQTQINLSH